MQYDYIILLCVTFLKSNKKKKMYKKSLNIIIIKVYIHSFYYVKF